MRNHVQNHYSITKGNTPFADEMLLGEIAINLPDEKVYVKKNDYNQLFSLLSENNVRKLIYENNACPHLTSLYELGNYTNIYLSRTQHLTQLAL